LTAKEGIFEVYLSKVDVGIICTLRGKYYEKIGRI